MKKLIITIIIISSFSANAQSEFKIGFQTGINYPDIRGYEYAKYQNFNIGYLFGISFDYYLSSKLSLKTNVNYERKVQELRLTYYNYEAQEIGTEDFNRTFQLLNVPILLKYEFWNSNLFVNGGPFLNFVLNDDYDSDYPNQDLNSTEKKKIDFGLSLGIGTNISLNENHNLIIEIRDDFGLIDTGGIPERFDGTAKTNMIKLILGWNMGI